MHWAKEVGQVFNIRPRTKSRKTAWIARVDLERSVTGAIAYPSMHVSIDGPTGTGKSSLVLNSLTELRIKALQVQVSQSMTWPEFCRVVIPKARAATRSVKLEASAGVEKGLPNASIKGVAETGSKAGEQFDLVERMAAHATEHDIAHFISNANKPLIIDDLERGSDELIARISDLCRLLIQSFPSERGKLVMVGANDFVHKLFEANRSLDGRVQPISVGAFREPEGFACIGQGLRILGLRFPGYSSLFPRDLECERAVNEAAGALPKSVNKLGSMIALTASRRGDSINARTIIECAHNLFRTHVTECKRKFPLIAKVYESHPEARLVLEYMFEHGSCSIYHYDKLCSDVSNWSGAKLSLDLSQVEMAIEQLCSVDLLTRTGLAHDTIFTKDPKLAHTLGRLARESEKYPDDPFVQRFLKQQSLPFVNFPAFDPEH